MTGHEKLRISVMLSVLAGAWKLTPFVILKGRYPPKGKFSSRIIFRSNEKGLIVGEFMAEWLIEDLQYVSALCRPSGRNQIQQENV
jgi:hypothetical protein